MGRFSASQPMLTFFKKTLQTALIVAARVFVGFDRLIVPGILDDTVFFTDMTPKMDSTVEALATMGAFKTSTKPLCEAGLLAPSEGLPSMSSPIHAIGLRITHPDILVAFEKTSDPTVMSKCFRAIAFAVAGCIVELQADDLLIRTGIFFHEFMSQIEVPTLEAVAPPALPSAAPIDVESIVQAATQAATEAARQVALTTVTQTVTHTSSGPMRRR